MAESLRDWLKKVLQNAHPFVSSKDIKQGTRWLDEVNSHLDQLNVGIICVTKENLSSPWLNFEAGALAKALNGGRVFPLLLDMEHNELPLPLNQFQATLCEREGLQSMVTSINEALGDLAIESDRLLSSFDIWWSELEEKLVEISEMDALAQRESESRDNDDNSQAQVKQLIELLNQNLANNSRSSPTEHPNLARDEYSWIKEGLRVHHSRFGDGTVTEVVERTGGSTEVAIQFDETGHKRVVAQIANLTLL